MCLCRTVVDGEVGVAVMRRVNEGCISEREGGRRRQADARTHSGGMKAWGTDGMCCG